MANTNKRGKKQAYMNPFENVKIAKVTLIDYSSLLFSFFFFVGVFYLICVSLLARSSAANATMIMEFQRNGLNSRDDEKCIIMNLKRYDWLVNSWNKMNSKTTVLKWMKHIQHHKPHHYAFVYLPHNSSLISLICPHKCLTSTLVYFPSRK